MTLRLGGDGAITGCTSLEEPTISISGLTMTTPIEATSGTAAAPSYTFSGDTDNGLYYAGTNSIGLATAGNNAILIDSAGNVGIGTTSPSNLLTVDGEAEFTEKITVRTGATGSTLWLENGSGTSSASSSQLNFGNTEGAGQISYNDALNHSLNFDVKGQQIVRMKYEDDGDQGLVMSVGMPGGDAMFNVVDSGYLAYESNSGDPHIKLEKIGSGNSTTGKITTDSLVTTGNVGIGTTSPAKPLHIADTVPLIRFEDTNNSNALLDVSGSGGDCRIGIDPTSLFPASRFSVDLDGSERLRIDTSGRLLVGTSSSSQINTAVFQGNSAAGSAAGVIISSTISNPSSTQTLGKLVFADSGHVDAASIKGSRDGGTWTSGSSQPSKLTFFTTADGAASPTERLSIDSSGKLQFYGNSSSSWILSAASDNGAYSQIDAHFPTGNRTLFSNSNTANDSFAVWNRNSGSSGKGFGLEGQNFKVVQGSTEQMRIDSSGRLLVGTSTDSAASDSGIVMFPNGAILQKQPGTTAHDFHDFYRGTDGSMVRVGNIRTTGSATSYNESSDYRLKENVVDIVDGITRLKQLQPRRFNFIIDAETTVDGFIAHEAQAVVPQSVTGTKDEVDDDGNPVMQGIDKSKLVPLLTAALQEAIAKIETLETKVQALEAG